MKYQINTIQNNLSSICLNLVNLFSLICKELEMNVMFDIVMVKQNQIF